MTLLLSSGISTVPPPFGDLWFQLIIGALVGISLGSFATMLSYRLPRHLSIVKPDSFCPSCHTSLGFLDLIPIGSWIFMRGKCRHCRRSISARYPLIELVTGLMSMIAFAFLGFQLWLIGALLLITIAVTIITVRIERISDR